MMKKGKLKLTTYLKKRFYQPGLTLVELLVVLGIIGALGGIVTIEGERARDTARDHAIITHLSEAPAEALSYRGERATFVDFCQSPAWRQIQGGIIGQDRTVANITCHGTETHFCAQVALHTGGFFCVDGAGNLLRVDTLTCQAGHVGCVELVGDIAIIFAEPTVFHFEATVNQPLPAPQTLSIWNAGPGVLEWRITEDVPWLRLNPMEGSSTGPEEVNIVSVSIVNPLPSPGSHSAVIRIHDRNVPGATKEIRVNLRVVCTPTCGAWGACSVTCGGGTQTRTCTNADCSTRTENQACNTHACPPTCTPTCGAWGACSVTCGGGTQTRTCTNADCSTRTENQACNTHTCPETCTPACGAWGACSVTCGGGTQTRTCTNADCSTRTENQACNTHACPPTCEPWCEENWSHCMPHGSGCSGSKFRMCTRSDCSREHDWQPCTLPIICICMPSGISSCRPICQYIGLPGDTCSL